MKFNFNPLLFGAWERAYKQTQDQASYIMDRCRVWGFEDLDPDEYFQEDRLVTLDDTKRYESSLKEAVMRLCEDRDRFSRLMDRLGIKQPKSAIVYNFNEAKKAIRLGIAIPVSNKNEFEVKNH